MMKNNDLRAQDSDALQIEKSWQDECDECGDSNFETYFVPSWQAHRCYGCLMHEAKKFGYTVSKVSC